jgi:hypothetical protein
MPATSQWQALLFSGGLFFFLYEGPNVVSLAFVMRWGAMPKLIVVGLIFKSESSTYIFGDTT